MCQIICFYGGKFVGPTKRQVSERNNEDILLWFVKEQTRDTSSAILEDNQAACNQAGKNAALNIIYCAPKLHLEDV